MQARFFEVLKTRPDTSSSKPVQVLTYWKNEKVNHIKKLNRYNRYSYMFLNDDEYDQ